MNIKSINKKLLLTSALCLLLMACVKKLSTCETSVNDSVWVTFRGQGISEKLVSVRKSGAPEQAVSTLGKPDKTVKSGNREEMIWVVGNRRSSKTFQCGTLTDETYQVSYELTKISFVDGRNSTCNLEVINFIGKNGSPDPFVEAPIASESMACR